MCATLRSVLAASSFVCLSGVFTPHRALAQVENEVPSQVGRLHQSKQIALTEKQVQAVLAAQKSVDAINAGLNMALSSLKPQIDSENNVELVAKYYDKLIEITDGDEE